MTHEELKDLYELYALGVLDGEEKSELEEHLARQCPECTVGIKQALNFTALMAMLPESVEPSNTLRRRVLASVGLEPQANRLWLGALAALTACLLVGMVVLTLENTRRRDELAAVQTQLRQSTSDRARIEAAFRFLNEPETKQAVFGKGQPLPPRGRFFVNPRGILLLAANLAPVPTGKTYEMWLIPTAGAPIPAGLFQSDSQGNALFLSPATVNVAGTKAIAVTVEDRAGTSAPTSTPLIAAAISD